MFASIQFEVVPFCIETAIPTEALPEVISRQRLRHVLRLGLDFFRTSPIELQIHLREQGGGNQRGRGPVNRDGGG